jgi:hypothetical protein
MKVARCADFGLWKPLKGKLLSVSEYGAILSEYL